MVLIDSKGRKPLLLVGSAGMALAGIALTVVLVVKGSNPAASGALGWVAIVLVLLYVMFFEIGLGSIPWLIGGELLPEAPRASGMAAAAGVNWIFTTVIALGFQPVKAALGAYCFLPFVGFLVATFLFALRFGACAGGRRRARIMVPGDVSRVDAPCSTPPKPAADLTRSSYPPPFNPCLQFPRPRAAPPTSCSRSSRPAATRRCRRTARRARRRRCAHFRRRPAGMEWVILFTRTRVCWVCKSDTWGIGDNGSGPRFVRAASESAIAGS